MTELGAQESGKIIGTVTDAASGLPIPDALVTIVGTPLGSQTDREGRYAIDSIVPGILTLRVRMVGYRASRTQPYAVSESSRIRVDFKLEPLAVDIEGLEVTARRVRTTGHNGALPHTAPRTRRYRT